MMAARKLESWLQESETDPDLITFITAYVRVYSIVQMKEIVRDLPARFQWLGLAQDTVGWTNTMQGMILHEITKIQSI